MKKIFSFTLLETIVAMVIASLIIFFAITMLGQIQKINARTINDSKYSQDIFNFYSVLKNDIDLANYVISINNNQLIIKKENSENILYNFENDYVIRSTNLNTDTFEIKISNFSISKLNENCNYVKELDFIFLNKKDKLPVMIIKDYPTEVKFNCIKNKLPD